MPAPRLSLAARLAIAVFIVMAGSNAAHAQWKNLNNSFPGHPDTCLLLTNGDVMCHEYRTANWHRLHPDNTGSYVNGTWDSPSIASMPNGTDASIVKGVFCSPCTYAPLYFASQVLPDGRVVIIGGEDNTNGQTWTNIGFMYDPYNTSQGTWSAQLNEPFGTGNIGDAQSIVLQNGTMLLANISTSDAATYDPSTLTFTAVGATGKLDRNDEEGWTMLPNGNILTVDAGVANSFEILDPTTFNWGNSGNTAGVTLTDLGGNCNSQEVGPAVARPDGTIVNFTGNTAGQNAVYNIAAGTWSHNSSMDFPSLSGAQYGAADAPASVLPDGHVLVQSSPVVCQLQGSPPAYSIFNTPSHFFEWDGSNLNQVTDSSGAGNLVSYQGRMLVLPTGEILFTAFDQNNTDVAQVYSNGNPPQDAWRPVITNSPGVVGQGLTYTVSGYQFNGFSLGAAYGDDAQSSTNYPLIRITNNGSGHVRYVKTHDPSRMGTVTVGDTTSVSTQMDIPGDMELGASKLVVVTNGIPSQPVDVDIELPTTLVMTGATTSDFNDAATVSALLTSAGNPIAGKTVTFNLGGGGGTDTCVATTNGAGLASCSVIPTQMVGSYTLSATFASDSQYAGSSASASFVVTLEETALAFTASSATTADFDDPATVQAQLTTDSGTPLAGKSVTLTLGSGGTAPTCTVTTDASGNATCSLTPNQPAGNYNLTASFTSDGFYQSASAAVTFVVTKEETTTKFTASSPTVIANNHNTTFSATLMEDGTTPISGRTLTVTLGAQSCNGTTDATGTASCSILVNQPLGPGTVSVSFAGDPFYLPSSASESVIVFSFLASGSMIIGDLNSATGSAVEYWGAQWAGTNALSGGPAPDAFKGFASTAPQACGGTWSSGPGNSPGPPATVPSYMGVIVSSSVGQSGSSMAGNVPMIIVVKTNPGYGPAPGHAGSGTVVAVFCK